MTESEFDIQTKIVREPLPPIRNVNPNISENLEGIISKATEKDVNYRFQNCDEFIKAFEHSGYNYSAQKTVFQPPAQNKTAIYPQYDNRQPGTTAGSGKSKLPVILAGAGALVIILILVIYFATQDDSASVQKTTTTNQSSETKPPPVETKKPPPVESEPAEVVRSFIIDLGNGDFNSAYQKQTNKAWGDYSFFSSSRSFGGITSTTIENVTTNYENSGEASVYVDYTAIDPANKNGRYKQDFYLKKTGGGWKIYKVKNINVEQW
ncbi:MAG: hypothetical protein IAE90_01435 [Ignavibacteria bacterium]|nr:hypothetical protein [Ignavibacteria bacterium]